ncbi:MAG: response regulator [Opitutaceae bacterium]
MPQSVLIVDDSLPLHELVKVHLSDETLVHHSAYDGPSALAMAAALMPDLILLDVDMPGLDGFEVCRLLKSDPATEKIPIVFLTAAASSDEKMCGFELRAVDYVTKPFDPRELCARVRSALRTKRLLDMLPVSESVVPHAASQGQPGDKRQVNARLSMGQLAKARSQNPWNRKPPGSNEAEKICT